MKKIKVVIQRHKWRTGGHGLHATGRGPVQLENEFGYHCCLGFCVKAINPNASITNLTSPAATGTSVPWLCENNDYPGTFKSTKLAAKAMVINDHPRLLPHEREQQLQELFKDTFYDFKFVGSYEFAD